ncbi:MAG: hypothetical protein O2968_05570 [Acidobacteria bacterium]|nr:hypothetical protein [Acidobacteriota bacterium]
MLRLFYRCLLRLHPSRFRQRYQAEMLWIFDQQDGAVGRVAVVGDGFVSLARQWLFRPVNWQDTLAAAAAPVARSVEGIPSFYTFEAVRPRSATVLNGMLWSAGVFWVLAVAISHGGPSGTIRLPRVEILPDNVSPEVVIAQMEAQARSTDSQRKTGRKQLDTSPVVTDETSTVTPILRPDPFRLPSPSGQAATRTESLTLVRPAVPQTKTARRPSAPLGKESSEILGPSAWMESLMLDPSRPLSEEQRIEFAKRRALLLIRVLDSDDDGAISREESGRATELYDDLFDRTDLNHDGVVTREELRIALQAILSSALDP